MEVSKTYNLKIKNPVLASQWHPVKNGDLTPEDVTPNSNKTVRWICTKGHEWQATINRRSSKGTGCPYCAGKKVNKENCLKTKNPLLSLQWHPQKNGDLSSEDVLPNSKKVVWWKCVKGHEWQEKVVRRNRRSIDCPYCSGKRATKENCLKTNNPLLAREWHPGKNGKFTPEDFLPYSNKTVWWICTKGHEWQAKISTRNVGGTGCPYCSNQRVTKETCLKTRNPSLARQWHPEKNGDLTPKHVTPNSSKKVWWLCEKGHEWRTTVSNRNFFGNGCPYCNNKSAAYALPISNPVLAKMWHPLKNGNLTPADVTANSIKKVWWLCKKGHEWREKVYLQDRVDGCALCIKNNADQKKSPIKNTSKSKRGPYKPILAGGKGSVAFYVLITLDEKKSSNYKGKRIERRKSTTYARYVYGLDRIPEGWVIWHKDGDPLNNNIENLECISMSELGRRNLRDRYKT